MNENTQSSPIDVIWPALAAAPFNLAPERREELRILIEQRNIQFQLDRATHEIRFEGAELFGGLGLVCVGIHGLERLWAHTYGMIHVYLRFQNSGFKQSINLTDTSEGKIAARLMEWALNGEIRGDPTPWPDDLPRPQASPVDDQIRLTNEVFIGAVGFAVLHEIGHIVRGHSGTQFKDIAYRYEFEADEWAYDWVMDKWREYEPQNPAVYGKRCLLIAELFALIAINHVYAPRNTGTSDHPHSIDRLLRFLIKHANEENGLNSELAWALSSTALSLQLSQVTSESLPVCESFRDYFCEIRRRFPKL
jgi:hypothetical protein